MAKWIQIKYVYLLKYCNNCKLQEENQKECFVLYLEVYPKEEQTDKNKVDNKVNNSKENKKEPENGVGGER